jgi:hypothetical protein
MSAGPDGARPDKARRRELAERYRETPREAAVYIIRNTRTGGALLGSTHDLAGLRSRLEFARTTGIGSALDGRLAAEIRRDGIEAFELEVLDTVERRPGSTDAETAADLAVLEALWREKLDPATDHDPPPQASMAASPRRPR